MSKLPNLKVTYIEDESIPIEERRRNLEKAYDIVFKGTMEMMEKSSDPADIAFLKKFPYLREQKFD